MSEYKRLTEKDWHKEKFYPQSDNERVMRKRLWDLENKIEQGTLIELPCKVGDTVYKVYGKCGGNGCPYNGNNEQWRCHYKWKERCKAFMDECNFSYVMLNEIGKNIFVTKEAAEARLKELQEEKK